MEIDFVFFGDAAGLCEWLDGANLVVGMHDCDEDCFGAYGLAEGFGIDSAFVIDWQIRDADSLLFCGLASV